MARAKAKKRTRRAPSRERDTISAGGRTAELGSPEADEIVRESVGRTARRLRGEQGTLPGVEVEHVTPDGPLHFKIVAAPGKAPKGEREWSMKASLRGAYCDRFQEAAELVGQSVRVTSEVPQLSVLSRVTGATIKADKIDGVPPSVVVILSGDETSPRLLGLEVEIEAAQLKLPLGERE